jgi:hypothetical protein
LSLANLLLSGALIGTDFVYNNASAAEAYQKFPDFARRAFQPACALLEKWPWLRSAIRLLNDSSYDSGALDGTIQDVCQRGRRLFDVMPPSTAGRRLAIVVSRVSDGKPGVFPNYRGVGRRGADPTAYQATLFPDPSQNPLLWEV